MNKDGFTKLIQYPEIISNEITLEVEHITKKYPYFHAAKSLYLKGLKQNNNYKSVFALIQIHSGAVHDCFFPEQKATNDKHACRTKR